MAEERKVQEEIARKAVEEARVEAERLAKEKEQRQKDEAQMRPYLAELQVFMKMLDNQIGIRRNYAEEQAREEEERKLRKSASRSDSGGNG